MVIQIKFLNRNPAALHGSLLTVSMEGSSAPRGRAKRRCTDVKLAESDPNAGAGDPLQSGNVQWSKAVWIIRADA